MKTFQCLDCDAILEVARFKLREKQGERAKCPRCKGVLPARDDADLLRPGLAPNNDRLSVLGLVVTLLETRQSEAARLIRIYAATGLHSGVACLLRNHDGDELFWKSKNCEGSPNATHDRGFWAGSTRRPAADPTGASPGELNFHHAPHSNRGPCSKARAISVLHGRKSGWPGACLGRGGTDAKLDPPKGPHDPGSPR